MDRIGEITARAAGAAASIAVLPPARAGSEHDPERKSHRAPAASALEAPSTAEPPPPLDRFCDIDLPRRLFVSFIPERGLREIRRALSENERARLTRRAAVLREALRPWLPHEARLVEDELAAMLGGFRSLRQNGDEVDAALANLSSVLREFPLWTIAKASMAIARGLSPLDRRFAPNDAQIHAVVADIVADCRKTLARIEALLAAPVVRALPPAAEPQSSSVLKRDGRDDATAFKQRRPHSGDGRHAARVAADLAARKARREAERGV